MSIAQTSHYNPFRYIGQPSRWRSTVPRTEPSWHRGGGAHPDHVIQLTLLNVSHRVMSNICNHRCKHATDSRDNRSGSSAVTVIAERTLLLSNHANHCETDTEYKASGRVHVP